MNELEKERCTHHKQYVKHLKNYDSEQQPNCLECDGFGEDSRRYGWYCYKPNKLFIKRR